MSDDIKPLGQNLQSVFNAEDLLQTLNIDNNAQHTDTRIKNYQVNQIPENFIIASSEQPRENFDRDEMFKLTNSIREHGILQPIIVRKIAEDQYKIVAGERRVRAARQAKLHRIPAIVCDVDDNTAYIYALVENIQRNNLNPIEEAKAYLKLHKDFGKTHEEIAQQVGRSRSSITNSLRLLFLAPEVQELLADNIITTGHAKVLIGLDKELQKKVVEKICDKTLTTREVEQLVQDIKLHINLDKTNTEHMQTSVDNMQEQYWYDRLSDKLHAKIKLKQLKLKNKQGGHKYKITLTVDNIDEFWDLIK